MFEKKKKKELDSISYLYEIVLARVFEKFKYITASFACRTILHVCTNDRGIMEFIAILARDVGWNSSVIFAKLLYIYTYIHIYIYINLRDPLVCQSLNISAGRVSWSR